MFIPKITSQFSNFPILEIRTTLRTMSHLSIIIKARSPPSSGRCDWRLTGVHMTLKGLLYTKRSLRLSSDRSLTRFDNVITLYIAIYLSTGKNTKNIASEISYYTCFVAINFILEILYGHNTDILINEPKLHAYRVFDGSFI